MRPSLLLFVAPLFLIACSATPKKIAVIDQQMTQPVTLEKKVTPSPSADKQIKAVIKQDFSKILAGNFRGKFSFVNGKGYFKGCDSNKSFSIKRNPLLNNIYEQITSSHYTPVYIEFSGEIIFSKPYQTEIDSIIRIDKVQHMALAKASLQCAKPIDSFLFKASGDDPYWRINIDNEQLLFSTKASNQAYNINISNFRTAQSSRIQTTNQKGQKLELATQPEHCYNAKKTEYWGYSTTVSTLWGIYRGCGEPGWSIKIQPVNGFYLSTSNNTTANLTLNTNYTVEYNQTINGIKTFKSGFWKANSPDRVVVMLTKEKDKKIRQELIFQRDNFTLSTTEINNENIISPIAGETLTFNKMNAQEIVAVSKVNRINREFVAQEINPESNINLNIQKSLNDYFNIHKTDPKNTKFSAVEYDLNGDGIDDAIVLLDWCSDKNGCEMLIFEGHKKGYQFSSRISPVHAPIIISKSQNYLWQSLLIEKEKGWSLVKFDGLSYPINTHNLAVINKDEHSTGVILFHKGKPTQWFPIKR